jgi:hypothetical protein
MLSRKKLQKAYHECMVELFKNATPSVNYDDLTIDENFDYEKYYLDNKQYEKIVESIVAKYKITSKIDLNSFYIHVYLGHGPTSKEPK